jgi:hypothetical protein
MIRLTYAASFTILHVCMYAEKRQQPSPFNMMQFQDQDAEMTIENQATGFHAICENL